MKTTRTVVAGALAVLAVLAPSTPSSAVTPPPGQADLEQRGVSVWSTDVDDYASAGLVQDLWDLRGAHASWVTLTPTWYQDTGTSNVVAPDPVRTPSDESLALAVLRAHDLGLSVFLSPHLDVRDGTWRGFVDPGDPAAWYASYTRYVRHYAELAESLGVEQLSIGLEMRSVEDDTERWRAVIADARGHFGGALTYGANHDSFEGVGFWGDLDLIGVDAYFPLSGSATTDVAALRRAWAPIADRLEALSVKVDRPVLFTEVGYASGRGTTTRPWEWEAFTTPDQAEQAAAYTALLETFEVEPWFAGVHWWHWDHLDGREDPIGFPLRAKEAADVLRAHWSPLPPLPATPGVLGPWADVTAGDPHAGPVRAVSSSGIAAGFGDGTFRPGTAVTRGQMASFLARALRLPPASRPPFPDVAADDPHARTIASVSAAGIATGFGDGTYRPGAPVTRGQMATFLTRALGLAPGDGSSFPDVAAEDPHAAAIGSVATAGIATGFGDGTFRPGAPVTRGQMATFLARALRL